VKFKPVPEAPEDLDFVSDVQRAVPLVPGTEDDCCARLMRRIGFQSRDVARTWLTFLRALELAEETENGFVRLRRDPDEEELVDAFQTRVYGVTTVLSVLSGDESLDSDAVFERFSEEIPTWERYKDPTRVEEVWRERVKNMLEWAVLLGLAEREDGSYRRA
jgi:DNA-directed RNA polymerase sigma subunit (sigma70/sigma32)